MAFDRGGAYTVGLRAALPARLIDDAATRRRCRARPSRTPILEVGDDVPPKVANLSTNPETGSIQAAHRPHRHLQTVRELIDRKHVVGVVARFAGHESTSQSAPDASTTANAARCSDRPQAGH